MLDIRLDPLLWQSGPLGLSWHGLWLTVALIAACQFVAAARDVQDPAGPAAGTLRIAGMARKAVAGRCEMLYNIC